MTASPSNLRRARHSSAGSSFFRRLLGVILLVGLIWFAWVYQQISQVSAEDQAQPADAIAVFGAAEYLGHPSPVFHARLDHAVELYRKQIAPPVIPKGASAATIFSQTAFLLPTSSQKLVPRIRNSRFIDSRPSLQKIISRLSLSLVTAHISSASASFVTASGYTCIPPRVPCLDI
jgi:hypothetical protein